MAPPTHEQIAAFQSRLPAFRASIAPVLAEYAIATCDGLIIAATGQAETAAYLVGALQPPRLAYIPTPGTESFAADLKQYLPDLADYLDEQLKSYHQPATPDDTQGIYLALKAILAHWPSQGAYFVDITGGRKPMSVGLAQAAHLFPHVYPVYVGSDYDAARNRFVDGTQHFVIPPDPYAIFGDLQAAEAERLWHAHDYAGAHKIFTDLAGRGASADQVRYRVLATLADAYHCWGEFALTDAKTRLSIVLASTLPAQLVPFEPILRQQAASLNRLSTTILRASGQDRIAALKTLADLPRMLDLLGTLDSGARRNEQRQDYDTAALLHYRCLELISQHRLATWDVLSEYPDFRSVMRRIPDLDQRYRTIEDLIGFQPRGLPFPGRNGKIPPLALFNGYMLLAALDDPLVRGYDITQIRDRAEARNKSILAHGYRLIDAHTYQRFAAVVDTLLDRFLQLGNQDRAAWEAAFRFVPLAA